jgi:ATP-dependent Zn protease
MPPWRHRLEQQRRRVVFLGTGKSLSLWMIIGLLLVALFNVFEQESARNPDRFTAYSEFLDALDRVDVREVTVRGKIIDYTLTDYRHLQAHAMDDPRLVDHLAARHVKFMAVPGDDVPSLTTLLIDWFPMLLLIAVWLFFMRQMKRSPAMSDAQFAGAVPQEATALRFLSRRPRFVWLMFIIVAVLTMLLGWFLEPEKATDLPTYPSRYSDFLDQLDQGRVADLTMLGKTIHYTLTDDSRTFAMFAMDDPRLLDRLTAKHVTFKAIPTDKKEPDLVKMVINWAPMLLLIGVWIFFMWQMQRFRGRADGQATAAPFLRITPFRPGILSTAVILGLLLIALAALFSDQAGRGPALSMPYSEFLEQIDKGQVSDVRVRGKEISFTLSDRRSFATEAMDDPQLVDRLIAKNVNFSAVPSDNVTPSVMKVLIDWFPMLLLIAVWVYFMRLLRGPR